MPTAATATAIDIYNSASICFSTPFLRSYTCILYLYFMQIYVFPINSNDHVTLTKNQIRCRTVHDLSSNKWIFVIEIKYYSIAYKFNYRVNLVSKLIYKVVRLRLNALIIYNEKLNIMRATYTRNVFINVCNNTK